MTIKYLGNPDPRIKKWIEDHVQPTTPSYTTIYYVGGTSSSFEQATIEWSMLGKTNEEMDADPAILKAIGGTNCTTIDGYAFAGCYSLTTATFPACTTIDEWGFYDCNALQTISFPCCTSIGDNAFESCGNLTTVDLPVCTSLGEFAFYRCSNLSSIYIRTSNCTAGEEALTDTAITLSNGRIYVPSAYVESYKNARVWKNYSDFIVGI